MCVVLTQGCFQTKDAWLCVLCPRRPSGRDFLSLCQRRWRGIALRRRVEVLREVGEEVEVREEVGTSELDQSFSVVSAVSEALPMCDHL